MKKALILLTFLCLLLMITTAGTVHAEQNVTVVFNETPLEFDVPPVIVNGRTLVPLRAIFEALGAEVSWDDASETAIGVRRGVRVSVTVDSAAATINGKAVTLDQPAVLKDGRTLVPLRFISEAYGAEVGWDEATQTVNIHAEPAYAAHHVNVKMFEDLGTWNFSGNMLVGTQTGLEEGQKAEDLSQDAVASIYIDAPGKYNLWVRDRDYANNQPGSRFFHVAVDGVRQDKVLGAHGQEGFRWTFVAELDLSEGLHQFALQDTSCFFARCEGFFLTQDLDYTPSEDPEELAKVAVPVSDLDNIPIAIYPGWSKREMTDSKTVTIGNDTTKINFYEGIGFRGAVVQNEILVKDNTGNFVTTKARDEELGVLMMSAENSVYKGYTGSTTEEVGGVTATQTLTIKEKEVVAATDNFYVAGIPYWFIPQSVEKISDTEAVLSFAPQNGVTLKVTYSFDTVSPDPKVTLSADFAQDGAYSFLLYSGDEITDGSFEQVTAPFLYVKKHVPETATMVPACYLFTPMATFTVDNNGSLLTKGIAMDPQSVPRSVPYPETSPFCLTLRTPTGNLRGQFAAPQFGTEDANFKAGESYTVSFRIINRFEDWYDTYTHVVTDIYDNADIRENVYGSLNDAIYNLDKLMLDDIYGGWDAKNMGWYNMEAKGVSSQANFMTAVQRYLLTGNEDMLEKRAIPTLANLLSRINAHFCRHDIETTYTDAPTVLAETPKTGNAAVYTGLYEMSQGRMPILLNTAINKQAVGADVEGITAQTAYYRITGEDKYITQIKANADAYINKTFNPDGSYMNGYFDQAFVFGDYLPKVAAFTYAYELTGEQKYLDAAYDAAKLLLTATWTTGYHNGYGTEPYEIDPAATEALHKIRADSPDSSWFMHGLNQWRLGYPYGVFGLTSENPVKIPAETVQGFQPTITGFGTEHPVTPAHGNAITMNTWAPLLQRLALYTGDEYLNTQARNAIIGRFTNYPGYYQDRYITHQQQPNYPYDGPDYTLVYWHHIPVFQSMLEDFLISSAIYRSEGKLEIPALQQHGYAYFITNQYGHKPAKFYDEDGLWLWLDEGIITPDSVNVDYIMGRKDGKFAAVLMNESATDLTTTVSLGDMLPEVTGDGILYDKDGNKSGLTVNGRQFTVTIPAKGMVTVMLNTPALTVPAYALDEIRYTFDNHKTVSEHTNGYGYVLQLDPEKYYAYIYVTDMAADMKALHVTYTVNGKTETQTITEYPFETILKVDGNTPFTYTLKAEMQNGSTKDYGGGTLEPLSEGAETNIDAFKTPEPADWGKTKVISGKFMGVGSASGVFRMVVDNKDMPLAAEANNLTGCKVAATITNTETGEQKTLITTLAGNEMRTTNIVLLAPPTEEVPLTNFNQPTWEVQFNLYPSDTPDKDVIAPEVKFEVAPKEPERDPIELKETFTAPLLGMGVNVQFRGVLEFKHIPFDIYENAFKGYEAEVTITDTETNEVKVLKNTILGNEMRSTNTVILLDFTEAVPTQNFSGTRYKAQITIYPNK